MFFCVLAEMKKMFRGSLRGVLSDKPVTFSICSGIRKGSWWPRIVALIGLLFRVRLKCSWSPTLSGLFIGCSDLAIGLRGFLVQLGGSVLNFSFSK